MTTAHSDIILAYRHLYRHLLRAVQYTTPGRYTFRSRLRTAFRKGSAADFNQAKIDNTLEFLDGAAREKGIEHRIVKNLAFVWWYQDGPVKPQRNLSLQDPKIRDAYLNIGDGLNHTIHMLNESMGTCIPTKPFISP